MPDEERSELSGRVGDGRGHQAAPTKLVKGGETRIPTQEEWLIAFFAADQNRRGKAGIFENAPADQVSDVPRRRSMRKALADNALGAVEAALPIPAAQSLEIVSADLCIHIANLHHIGQHADFVLRGEIHRRFADRGRESKYFSFIETAGKREAGVAINARTRNSRVVGHVGGPSRNRVLAFGAFEQPNVNRFDRIEQFGGARREKVCKPGRHAGTN